MKEKREFRKISLGVFLLFSIALVACGRDTSTVEEALEGQWTMTDAQMNDEPLVDLVDEYEEWLDFDTDGLVTSEEGQAELDVEFYYNDGILTIENSEGELTRVPYEIIQSNEENESLTLEYQVVEEGLELTIQEMMTYTDEAQESKTSQVHVIDVVIQSDESPGTTEFERELEQMGGEIVRGILQEFNLTFSFDYVAGEEAPITENPN